jgi:chaperonin GroES
VLGTGIICGLAPSTRECQREPVLLAPATTGSGLFAQDTENVSEGEVTTVATVAIKPLEDRVVVKPLDAEQTTASGLVIPDTAKEKPQEGVVLAVGPGRFEDGQRLPLDVKEGDVVLYSKYGGTEVKYNNEEYLVLSARDLLAVVTK